jgi:hypothetical protein
MGGKKLNKKSRQRLLAGFLPASGLVELPAVVLI